MSKIRSSSTAPELIIQQLFADLKIDIIANAKGIEGKPDIYIQDINAAIFVNGCFWHCHNGCKYFKLPSSNKEFWKTKLHKNVVRDIKNYKVLKNKKVKVLIIWECDIKNGKYLEKILKFLLLIINTNL